jgi:hypothetical protein
MVFLSQQQSWKSSMSPDSQAVACTKMLAATDLAATACTEAIARSVHSHLQLQQQQQAVCTCASSLMGTASRPNNIPACMH